MTGKGCNRLAGDWCGHCGCPHTVGANCAGSNVGMGVRVHSEPPKVLLKEGVSAV